MLNQVAPTVQKQGDENEHRDGGLSTYAHIPSGHLNMARTHKLALGVGSGNADTPYSLMHRHYSHKQHYSLSAIELIHS